VLHNALVYAVRMRWHCVPIIVGAEERLLTDCVCIRCRFSTLLHHKTCSLSVSRQVHVENCRERHKFRRVGLHYNAAAVVLFFIRLYTASVHVSLVRSHVYSICLVSYSVGTRCIVRPNENDNNNNNNDDTCIILLPILL